MRAWLIWAVVALAIIVPLAVAAGSPQLAWRRPAYIAAGFAGVLAMGLLFLQPLLAGGYLPGLRGRLGRRVHAWIGATLLLAVVAHIGGLWVTSPPDVIDVLLFRSPTPFSIWGAIAMWAVFAAGLLATLRRRLRLRPRLWRLLHTGLAITVVVGSVVHAMLIEGTMGAISKAAICGLAVAALVKVVIDLRTLALLKRRRAH